MNDQKPKPGLTEIACQMRRRALAAPGQPVRQSLTGGLHLTMICRLPVRWQLSLTRQEVAASPKEIEVCRKFFGVPLHVRREIPRPQTIGETRWHTIRLVWEEPEQLTLIEGESGPVAVVHNNYQESQ